jgi:hypothetical protein
MRMTFSVAAALLVVALAIAAGAYRRTLRDQKLVPEDVRRLGFTKRRPSSIAGNSATL